MLIDRLAKKGLIHPHSWLPANTAYLVMMGSVAYGASGDTSDMDIHGFCIPPKTVVFPHLGGEITGFGEQQPRFGEWSEHHVKDPESGREYDFTVYNIVKFFHLAMENNPNMVDTLFVPPRCVLHATKLAQHVRANRKLFLHKGGMHKLRGYASSQMSKIKNKTNSTNEKRAASIEQFGYDVKFGYHVVRLLLQAEQVLVEGDLDLERNSEILKAIRRGEWTLERLDAWHAEKERSLETLYAESKLREVKDEAAIRRLLLECLEMHYGSLDNAVAKDRSAEALISDMKALLARYETGA